MKRIRTIDVVYANWCPHCVPTTVEPMKKLAAELDVPCRLYDIDTDDVKAADELVKKYGDWSPDYLIPQVFLEYEDGEIKHVLTGYPEGVAFTRRAVENLIQSELFSGQKAARIV
jgi:thiol-disulfide isomerase/thioredoxin